jgi:hypothetical protein
MDTILTWLSANPAITTALLDVAIGLILVIIFIYVIAFFQGREISFWPPRIGEKQDKKKKSSSNNAEPSRNGNQTSITNAGLGSASSQGNITADHGSVAIGGNMQGNIYISASDQLARAERKTDEARQKVREWGQRINQVGWDEQAWHLLGFALQFAHEAIEVKPDYQRAWTLLADVYHRIGKDDLAKKCLRKSYSLASPGPNFPGRFYKEVDNNIHSGFPFNSSGGLKRQSTPAWFEEKYKKYWSL